MILLDTNALLWLYLDHEHLGHQARGLITRATRVYYSSVSISEIAIKHMLGRIPLPGTGRFPAVFNEMGLVELPFRADDAAALLGMPELNRHDPFDRFLIAQAATNSLDFLTSDLVMLGLDKTWIIDARQ